MACWPSANPFFRFVIACGVGICFFITSGRLRACHHTLLHHASHSDFGKASRLIGESAAMIAFTMSLDEYKPKHMYHHGYTADADDPELETVLRLGFEPGHDLRYYRRQLVRVLLSPRMLALHFGRGVPGRRKALVTALHATPAVLTLAAAVLHGSLMPVAIYACAWLLPWTVGVYCSLILSSYMCWGCICGCWSLKPASAAARSTSSGREQDSLATRCLPAICPCLRALFSGSSGGRGCSLCTC